MSLTLLRREGDTLYPLLFADAEIVSQDEAQELYNVATGAESFFGALAEFEEAEQAVEED